MIVHPTSLLFISIHFSFFLSFLLLSSLQLQTLYYTALLLIIIFYYFFFYRKFISLLSIYSFTYIRSFTVKLPCIYMSTLLLLILSLLLLLTLYIPFLFLNLQSFCNLPHLSSLQLQTSCNTPFLSTYLLFYLSYFSKTHKAFLDLLLFLVIPINI